MGCYSWLDCQTGKPIMIGEPAYVLVPESYKEKYGNIISESEYDGYGHFGMYDIYELVAEWNKDNLDYSMLRDIPQKEQYGGLWSYQKNELREAGKSEEEIQKADEAKQNENYQNACKRWAKEANRLLYYHNGMPHSKMVSMYSKGYLREIGISIACYDDQNKALPYPIKITHNKNAVYEKCAASLSDPSQGCQ